MPTGASPLTTSLWPAQRSTEVREATAGGILRDAAAIVPERVALVDGAAPLPSRRRWTYGELLADSERLARALLTRHTPGERIGLYAPNSTDWILLRYAAAFAGLVLVPLNPAYRPGEAGVMLRTARVTAIFHAGRHRDNDIAAVIESVRDQLPELRETVVLEDLSAYKQAGDRFAGALPDVLPDDVSHVQFTSGTTGIPKGALIHHRGMVNSGRFVAERAEFPEGGVWVNAMPMFHSGGIATSLCGCHACLGTFVLAPGFDAGAMLELIESERANITLIVPTMILALLEHPTFAERDLSSMRTILSGATDVPAPLVNRTKAELGCGVSILFGQSEVCGVVTQTQPDDSVADQAETVGRPLPGADVKIAGADGEPVALGESGEICVRGYQTMHGYLDMARETRETIDEHGWLAMGDLGTMDDRGFIRMTGRLKDVIVRGGLNIYSREIEDILFAHPAISQASVVGVPDERLGEIVSAVLVMRDAAAVPDFAELIAHCRDRLARHKTPALWFVVDAFPLTASGKVQKFMLRDWITAGTIDARHRAST
jgi:fatty-acyl-CoA synthase